MIDIVAGLLMFGFYVFSVIGAYLLGWTLARRRALRFHKYVLGEVKGIAEATTFGATRSRPAAPPNQRSDKLSRFGVADDQSTEVGKDA